MLPPRWIELLAKLAPGIVLALILVGLLVVFMRRPTDPEAPLRREGSWLMPRVLIAYWYWLITPLIEGLERRGVRPNHLTFGALGVALLAAVALGGGSLMWGTWLLVAAATLDLLDGLLARQLQGGSKSGAFLDSFVDRCAEGAVFGGLAYYGAGGPLTWVAIWAVVASILISYARARAEALGVNCSGGLMQRPERTFLLIITLFLTSIVGVFRPDAAPGQVPWVAVSGVGILALLSTFTAFYRADRAFRALKDDPNNHRRPPAQPIEPEPDGPNARGHPGGRSLDDASLESKAEATR